MTLDPKILLVFYLEPKNTADGRNPPPVDMVNIPVFTRFYTSQVLQDFFHQQYHHANSGKTTKKISARMCFATDFYGGIGTNKITMTHVQQSK